PVLIKRPRKEAEFVQSPPTPAEALEDDEDEVEEEEDDEIELEYHDDSAEAAADAVFAGEEDPEPSEAAEIPPVDEQQVPPPPRKEIVVKLPQMMKQRQSSPPPPPPKELGEYHLPNWDILAEAEHGYAASQEQFVRDQAALLERTLKEFGIDAHVTEIDTGPVITMYEIALAP